MDRKQIIEKLDSEIDFVKLGEWIKGKVSPAWGDFVIGIAAKQLEKRDDLLAGLLVDFIYEKAAPIYHPDLDAAFEAYVTGDYSRVDDVLVERAVAAIHTNLGDGIERIWLRALSTAIIETVMLKKAQYQADTTPPIGGGGGTPPGGNG